MINVDDRLVDEILPKIGAEAFAVLLVITRHIDKRRTAFPGIKRIREKTGLGKKSSYNAINTLIKFGYLQRNQINENGIFGKIIYKVTAPYIKIWVSPDDYEMEASAEEEPYATQAEYGQAESAKGAHISITQKEVLPNISITQSNPIEPPNESEHLGTTYREDENFSIYLGQSEATGLPHIEGGVIVSDRHNDLVLKSNEVGVEFEAYKDAMEKMYRMNITRVDRAVKISGRHREFFLESFTQHCFDKGFEIRHKRKEKGFLDWLDAHANFLRETPEFEAEKVEVTKPITKTEPKKPQEANAAPPQEDNLFTEYWERYAYKDRSESLKTTCLNEWQKLADWEKIVIKRALPIYLENKEEQYRKRPDGWLREKAYKEIKLELDTKLNNQWGDIEDDLNRLFWNDANQFVAYWQVKKRQGYLEELLPQFQQAAINFKNEKLQTRV